MEYHIYHLFPSLLNLYGDRGNILTLCFFAKQLGLVPIVHEVDNIEQLDFQKADFVLLGGGSDREQGIVTQYLNNIKDAFKQAIEGGLCCLAVCGGYQFLGKYYQDSNGNKLPGLNIFDIITIAQTKQRMLGNIVVNSDKFGKVVGFVNHAGETFHDYHPLGQSSNGVGNNLTNANEGLLYKNVIATYLHGPLLPKNPQLTFYFLEQFAAKKQITLDFEKIDLSFEEVARITMFERVKDK